MTSLVISIASYAHKYTIGIHITKDALLKLYEWDVCKGQWIAKLPTTTHILMVPRVRSSGAKPGGLVSKVLSVFIR